MDPFGPDTEIYLDWMRSGGWLVGSHNDYVVEATNERRTYWMFTHRETERWVDGDGSTDREALEQCWRKAYVEVR